MRTLLPVLVALGMAACSSGGAGALAAGADAGSDSGAAAPNPLLVPCTAGFTGAANGGWSGCTFESYVDSSDGTWWVHIVTTNTGGFDGNVLAVNGVNLHMTGSPRAGTFDFTSADVLDGLTLVTIKNGPQMVATKDMFLDGAPLIAGSMSLTVAPAIGDGGTPSLTGTLTVSLVNGDPQQSSPPAGFQAAF